MGKDKKVLPILYVFSDFLGELLRTIFIFAVAMDNPQLKP